MLDDFDTQMYKFKIKGRRTVSADGYLFQIGLLRTKVDVFHRNNQITKRGSYPEVKIISK